MTTLAPPPSHPSDSIRTVRRGRPTATVSPTMLSVERETAVDGTLILHVYGLLDLTTILPFRDALFTALGERPAHIELDLTGIRGFDAAGVSTLTTVMRVAATVRVPIQIVPSPELRDLLEETRLSRVLSVLPTGDDVARAIFGRK